MMRLLLLVYLASFLICVALHRLYMRRVCLTDGERAFLFIVYLMPFLNLIFCVAIVLSETKWTKIIKFILGD